MHKKGLFAFFATLHRLKAGVGFADDKGATTTADDLAIFVAGFGGF